MKKTIRSFRPDGPELNFHSLSLIMKILTLMLVMGMVLPAGSFSRDHASADLQQQIRVAGTIRDAATGQAMPAVNILDRGTTLGASYK